MEHYQAKYSKQEYGCYADLNIFAFFIDKSFQSFSYPLLSGTEREVPLQIGISLINVHVSYKKAPSIRFSEILQCLPFLKNKQAKIILMPKRHILWWQILFSFNRILIFFLSGLQVPRILNAANQRLLGPNNFLQKMSPTNIIPSIITKPIEEDCWGERSSFFGSSMLPRMLHSIYILCSSQILAQPIDLLPALVLLKRRKKMIQERSDRTSGKRRAGG